MFNFINVCTAVKVLKGNYAITRKCPYRHRATQRIISIFSFLLCPACVIVKNGKIPVNGSNSFPVLRYVQFNALFLRKTRYTCKKFMFLTHVKGHFNFFLRFYAQKILWQLLKTVTVYKISDKILAILINNNVSHRNACAVIVSRSYSRLIEPYIYLVRRKIAYILGHIDNLIIAGLYSISIDFTPWEETQIFILQLRL